MQIGNRLSFPKHPSKSRLSLLIIEIIALKDKQYRPKTLKTVIELEIKPEHLYTPRAYSGFSRDLLIIFPYVGVFSQWLLPELLMKSNKPHCIRKTIVWGSYWYKVCCLTSITKIVMPKIARKIEKKCQILRQLFRLWTVVAQCWYTVWKFHGKIGICEKIPYQTV